MSYISGTGSADNASRDSQLYRELQEQRKLEEKGEAAADRWEHDQIGAVFSQLDRYTVDGPSAQQTQSLLALAAAYATQPERAVAAPSSRRVVRHDRPGRQPAVAMSLPVRLIQRMAAQARTMHWLFWLISALMIGTGAAIEGLAASEWFRSPAKPDVFLFTILLLPVASVAYSLRSMHTPMSELEATFPVTPVQLMVARIGTILLYDLFLALLFYGILVMTGTSGEFGFSTAVLITDLLLPICLSTFAALAAMLRFGTWPGTAAVLAVGVIQFSAGERLGVFQLFSQYGSAHWLASKLVAVSLAVALGVCTSMLLRHRHYYKQQE
jgi:cytochrome b561